MNTLHIKKGDTVTVRSGVDKGKTGKVLGVFPKTGLVLVEGVGMYKKHQKPRKEGQKGQIVEKYHPIAASKVTLADKKEKSGKAKPTAAKTTKTATKAPAKKVAAK
ncbi:MAG: 50S ribosomal protein L24 [bacterium]